ncbi:MAG: hypothetical protein U0T73_11430 [Chitinophagales bacterium]
MHFLSHYFIDRSTASPYFVAGALMPDLVSGFTRYYNQKIIHTDTKHFSRPVREIHLGVLRHFEADKLFHQKLVFLEMVHLLRDEMLRQQLNRSTFRISFLAHIGIEAVLDKVLMAAHPHLLDQYYAHLQQVEDNAPERFLDELADGSAKSEFFHRFRLFREMRFLYRMKTMNGLAEGLCRTYEKVTGVKIAGVDREKLVLSLNNIEEKVRYSSQSLLAF